jgi:UDPglucose 6-dehydrogenase
MKKIIGLVGYGIVGKAHDIAFKQHCQVWINDPAFEDHERYLPKKSLMRHCAAIFVGVPTPYDPRTQTFTSDIIYQVFKELEEAKNPKNNPVIVIKSAVLPTVVMELQKRHPELRIVVSPEYLSERNSIADLLAQETLILGGKKEDRDVVIDLYFNHSSCNKKATIGEGDNAAQIALIKYMENSFLALKVIFMNEFKLLHDKMFGSKKDSEFNEIIKIHQLDTRMGGPYPYSIPGPDGHLGFGGKCLPKDLLSIIAEADEYGISMDILRETWKKNLEVREDRNWTEIKGAIEE